MEKRHMDVGAERRKAAERLKDMQPEYGAYGIGEIGAAVMGGGFTTAELRDRLIMLMEDGGWLDSAAERKCAELTAENAGLEMRGRMLRRALDEKEDELDRVLRERDEGWMRLPVDADGVLIHTGDVMETCCAEVTDTFTACFFAENGDALDDETSFFEPGKCRHVKPRTLEDVLHEFGGKAADDGFLWGDDARDLVDRYAAEIRELTEVD